MKYVVRCPHCHNLTGCIPNRAGEKNELGKVIKDEVACSKCNRMISTREGKYVNEPIKPDITVDDIDWLDIDQ